MFKHKTREQFFKDTLEKLIRDRRNERVKSIIVNVDSTNLIDSTGTTVLHLAAKYNNADLIEFLIEKVGYDVDGKDLLGMTSLMIAVLGKNYEAIECLLGYNADVFTANAAGNTALKMISETESYTSRTLMLFFDRVKSRYKTNEEIANKLVEASFPLDFIVELKNAELTRLILEKGEFIDDIESHRSIQNAFCSLDVDNIKVLLHFGVAMGEGGYYFFELFSKYVQTTNPNKWNHVKVLTPKLIEWSLVHGSTISIYEKLFEKGQLEPLKILFECGLDSHIKQKLGYDSIVHCFGNRNVDVFEILKENEFDINSRGRGDVTALHIAVQFSVVKNVKYLLENGSDPNCKSKLGTTPIIMCLLQPENLYGDDSIECVRLLLEYGADPQIIDKSGRCFFDYHEVDDKKMPVIEVVIARIALLEAFGVTVNPIIYECFNTEHFNDLKDCYKMCKKQIEEMKNFKICDSLTAFNVLSKKPEQLARIINAQDEELIKELLNSDALLKLSYYYYSTLLERLHIAVLMHCYRNNAADVVADNITMLQRNTLIIEKIVSNLTLKDLLVYETK